MTRDFPAFAKAVYDRLTRLSKHELFEVNAPELPDVYLAAFPAGTDPIYRVNTEHNCSCCRQFIRNFGNVVAIIDGRIETIWNIEGLPAPYDVVARRMHNAVKAAPVIDVFRRSEPKFGAERTVQLVDTQIITWHHFHGDVAPRHRTSTPDKARGDARTAVQVFRRGLDDLKPEALQTILDLAAAGNLYRGAESAPLVQAFQKAQQDYRAADRPDLMAWVFGSADGAAARFRNTAIGTLAQDLSEGMDLDRAVRAFEAKVAPTNYKRTTAIVTPAMIDKALKTLADLDLEGAVERRFARISDVAVTDVLFVDNEVRGAMKGGLRETLMAGAVSAKPFNRDKATPIGIEDFLAGVLPKAREVSLLLENRHLTNFVSLTAPVHENTGRLFKWANDFAWSYEGEVADSIKERVKRAGGNIEAPLRVSLAWSNHDDLDLHARAPNTVGGTTLIYYGNKADILDVDMNAGFGKTRQPVENLSWRYPVDGRYVIMVDQFHRRETTDVGFTLEVACNGRVHQFSHAKPFNDRQASMLSFVMKDGVLSDLKVLSGSLVGGATPVEKWGVKTGGLVPVSTVMLSPNHWDGAGGVGAKHWFFMLKDCRNPDPARGLYNEFLRPDLDPHRKVFEMLAARTRCQPTPDQLSGVGFTAARGEEVAVSVTTATSTRAYVINF